MLKFNNSQPLDTYLGGKYVHLKKGFGKFKVVDAAEKVSKNANPMAFFMLEVIDSEGSTAEIKEHIVFGNEYTESNIARFLPAVGRQEDWKRDTFHPGAYIGMSGSCEINHEDEFNKEKGRVFTNNKIWLMPKGGEWTTPKMTHKRLDERFYKTNNIHSKDTVFDAMARTQENMNALNEEGTNAVNSFRDDELPSWD